MKTYPNLTSIPDHVDTVVIMAPDRSFLPLLDECAAKNVKFIIHLTSFTGLVEDECDVRKTIKAFSEKTGIRIIGPNSVGLFNIIQPFGISSSLYYEPNRLQNGGISLITVDGGLGRTILDASDRGIGFNYWISTGNEADLQVADFVAYLVNEPSTQVIVAIIDGMKAEQKFRNAAEAASRAGKPLIVLNIGQPEMGEKENTAGIISVSDLHELMDVAGLFITQKVLAGNRIGLFTYSAGIKMLLAQKCTRANLPVPDLADHTKALLQELAPAFGMAANPIHVKTSLFQNLGVFAEYLETFANDPNLDVIVVPFPYKLGTYTEMMVRQTVELAKRMKKPIIPLWTSLSGEMEASYDILLHSQLPFFRTVDACIQAIKHYSAYDMSRKVLMQEADEEERSLQL